MCDWLDEGVFLDINSCVHVGWSLEVRRCIIGCLDFHVFPTKAINQLNQRNSFSVFLLRTRKAYFEIESVWRFIDYSHLFSYETAKNAPRAWATDDSNEQLQMYYVDHAEKSMNVIYDTFTFCVCHIFNIIHYSYKTIILHYWRFGNNNCLGLLCSIIKIFILWVSEYCMKLLQYSIKTYVR